MLHASRRAKARSPFRGKPSTRELRHRDGSLRGYRIRAEYLTPLRAKFAHLTAKVLVAGTMVAGICAGTNSEPKNDALALASVLIPPLCFPLVRALTRRQLRRTTVVEITADAFRINGLFGWKTYDRNIPHSFSLLQHDKAQKEWVEQDFDARKAWQKGKVLAQTKYYQESWHVVFDYALQRIDVADVYGLKDARAIQVRLAGCAQVIDALAGNGGGPVLHPEHAWADGPGGIPD